MLFHLLIAAPRATKSPFQQSNDGRRKGNEHVSTADDDRNDRVDPTAARPARRWWQRAWFKWLLGSVLAAALAAGITAEYVLQHLGPIVRSRVIATLSDRFHAPVELDQLDISLLKGIEVEGHGLRIPFGSPGHTSPGDTQESKPAVAIRVDHFRFRTTFKGLMHQPTDLGLIQVDGMVLDLPPGPDRGKYFRGEADPSNPKTKAKLAFTAREIDASNVKLLLETSNPNKDPMEFDIQSLKLTHVDQQAAMQYGAQLTNPKPRGDIHAAGHFGPWNVDEPSETALDGDYTFTHADLNTIKGIGGTLSSVGHFGGVLEKLTVDGTTDTPDFSLDISNHPLPLKTKFHAYVDATTGDTKLDPVDAWLVHTHILARGLVQKIDHEGHDIALDVNVPSGRIEDMLELGMKSEPPVMRAPMTLKAKLHIPPGHVRVAAKIEIAGTLTEHGIVFGNAGVQDKIDSLSMRAQGRPEEAKDAGSDKKTEVNSQLSTTFNLAHSQVLFSAVRYQVPGADIHLVGAYLMDRDRYDMRGHVRTDAKPSQMVTGWKSLLLKPMDHFLAKNGAGMELPIEISGEKKDMHFGLAHHGRADATAQEIAQEMKQQPTPPRPSQ